MLVPGVRLDDGRPLLEQATHILRQRFLRFADQANQLVGRLPSQGLLRGGEVLRPTGGDGIRLGLLVVAADGLGDLGEVAHARRRDDLSQDRRVPHVDSGQDALGQGKALVGQQGSQLLIERRDAVVVEGRRRGAEDAHVLGLLAEGVVIANQLATHVTQGVHRTAPLELVDRDDVGEVEHVDLLELAGRAVFGRHDVEGDVGEVRDRTIALADPGSLDDDEVVRRGLENGDDLGELVGDLAPTAGGERTEIDAIAIERIHPDPVAEQGAATLAAGWVDSDDRDPQFVLLVDPEAPHQLIGERGLARPTRAGDAKDRGGPPLGRHLQFLEVRRGETTQLSRRDGARDGRSIAGQHALDVDSPDLGHVEVAVLDDLVDHPDQAELLAVLGAEDVDAGLLQAVDLVGDDHTATTPDDLDVAGAGLLEQLDEVFEVLDVPALVGRDRHPLGVLLDRRIHDFLHGAVVAEVDDLGTLALHDPPHDVDRRVVAVEEAGRADDAHRVGRDVQFGLGRLGHR